MGRKLWRHISFSSTCSRYYRKHHNNDNKICPLLSFITDSQYLGTIQIWWNFSKHCYYLTSTKSVICQINANCSSFHSLNMLHFHIRLAGLKLTCYSLISNFSRYFSNTARLCLLCLLFFALPSLPSSHVFAALQFNINYFGILLWKIVKPRNCNETKLPIRKNPWKYKAIRHYLLMFQK